MIGEVIVEVKGVCGKEDEEEDKGRIGGKINE